jgi:CheY-specific phosphatase CheX
MNERLNQAVKNAIEETFYTMLNVRVIGNDPVEKVINGARYELNVVIGIVGEISGAITLKGSKKLATSIASNMLGIEIEENSDDMKDAIGEFLNIVMGVIKRHYSSDNPFDISVPTTILGEDYLVYTKASKNDKVSLIDFKYNGESFCIEIYLK